MGRGQVTSFFPSFIQTCYLIYAVSRYGCGLYNVAITPEVPDTVWDVTKLMAVSSYKVGPFTVTYVSKYSVAVSTPGRAEVMAVGMVAVASV